MFGYILRLDASRQKRVGTNQLKKLLKPEVYKLIQSKETKLNSAREEFSPFAPTIVRPSFYPSFLRVTDIRSIYWRVKNHEGFHDLINAYINPDSDLVFEFNDEVNSERVDDIMNLLGDYGDFDIAFKDNTKKKIVFELVGKENHYMG